RIAAFPHRRIGFRRLLSKTAIIGVVSEFTRSLINRHFPGHGERVVLVPGALRSDFRIPRSRKRSTDDPEIRVLTVARVHPRKGMHLVIEALSRLPASQRRNLIYQIVGPPSRPAYANSLKQLAAQLG